MSRLGTGVHNTYRSDATGQQIQWTRGDENPEGASGFAFAVGKTGGDVDYYLQDGALGKISVWSFDITDGVLEVELKVDGEAQFFQIYGVGNWDTIIGAPMMKLIFEANKDDNSPIMSII